MWAGGVCGRAGRRGLPLGSHEEKLQYEPSHVDGVLNSGLACARTTSTARVGLLTQPAGMLWLAACTPRSAAAHRDAENRLDSIVKRPKVQYEASNCKEMTRVVLYAHNVFKAVEKAHFFFAGLRPAPR